MQKWPIRMRALELEIVQEVATRLIELRNPKHGRVRNVLSGLQWKFALEPAGRVFLVASAAIGERMFEAKEPSVGGDRRSFDVACHCGSRHGYIDKFDLREEERLPFGTNRDFLANVVSIFVKDRLPADVQVCGRILELDANLTARNMIGGLGRIGGNRNIFDHGLSDNFEVGGTQHGTFAWYQLRLCPRSVPSRTDQLAEMRSFARKRLSPWRWALTGRASAATEANRIARKRKNETQASAARTMRDFLFKP